MRHGAMKVLGGILIGLLAGVAVVTIVVVTGAINVAATIPPSPIEERVADFVLDRSIAKRAPKTQNPFSASIAEGLPHYRANCLSCHGAPGVDPFEFGKGLNPPAPNLSGKRTQARTDGELFWIAGHGIRMTGMPAFEPTHTERELWQIVAFIRHLPELTAEERESLAAAAKAQEHHHDDHPDTLHGGSGKHPHPSGMPPHKH